MPCPLSSQCPVQWLAQGGRQHCRQQGQAGVSLAFGRILGHLDPPLQCFSIPGRGGSCRHIHSISSLWAPWPKLSPAPQLCVPPHRPAPFSTSGIRPHLFTWPILASAPSGHPHGDPAPGVGPTCCRCWFCTNEPVQKCTPRVLACLNHNDVTPSHKRQTSQMLSSACLCMGGTQRTKRN